MEFASIQHQDHASGDQHEEPGVDEPGQHGQAEIVAAQAEVELVGRERDDPRGACGEVLALLLADIALADHRCRPHQHGGEVVLAHAPAEGEEGVDEHHRDGQQLDLGDPSAGGLDVRQVGEDGDGAVGGAEHGEHAGEDDQGAGGEEGGVALQVADHAGVGDAVVAQQQAAHPVFAVQMHDRSQARGVPALPGGVAGVATPAEDEPEDGQQVPQVVEVDQLGNVVHGWPGAVAGGSQEKGHPKVAFQTVRGGSGRRDGGAARQAVGDDRQHQHDQHRQQPRKALAGERQVLDEGRHQRFEAGSAQAVDEAEDEGNEHGGHEDTARRQPQAIAEAQCHQDDRQGIQPHQHGHREGDQLGQPLVGHQQAERGQPQYHGAVGDRQDAAEELAARGEQADGSGQAGQGDDHGQQQAADGAEGVLNVGGEDLYTVLCVTGDALAGGPQIEEREVDSGQPGCSDDPGYDGVAGNQAGIFDTVVADGRGDDDAEYQRAQGVHGQVALQETFHQRRSLVGLRSAADGAGRHAHRGTAQYQQRGQQDRGDELADAVHQLAGIQRQEQHGTEVQHAVDEQCDAAFSGKGRNTHLEGNHGGTRGGEKRPYGQVNGYREGQAGSLTERRGQAVHAATDTCQGDHGEQRQADAGEQEAERGAPDIVTRGHAGAGRKNDVAGAKEQRECHEAEGQEVRAFQTSHREEYHRQNFIVSEGFPGVWETSSIRFGIDHGCPFPALVEPGELEGRGKTQRPPEGGLCSGRKALGLLHFPAGQLGQGLADVGQGTHGLHTGVLQGGELLVRSALAAGDDGAGVAHALAGRCGDTRDVGHHRLGHVGLDEGSGFFFSGTADLTDHDDRFGLRVFLEQLQDVDEVGARDRVATDAHAGGLAEAGVGGLLHGFIGQGAGTRHDAYLARQVDVTRHDADLALAGSDHARAVRADQAYAQLVALDLGFQHVDGRDAFGDADDQLDAAESRFEDGILAERSRNVDHRCVGAGGFHGFLDGVEHRQAEVGGAALAGGHAANHLGAVGDGLLGVEGRSLLTLRGLDDLLGSVGQAGRSDDVQTAFGQYLGAEFGVVAFQADDHRDLHADFLHCTDDAFGNHVATNDTAEDVHQYGSDVAVGQDDLEGFGHALFGRATADVEEVGRLATVQVDDVHGAHGQASAVDHAADVAFQRDVVQFPLLRMGFTSVVLGRVVHGAQLGLAVHGVAVDVDLGVQAVQVAVGLDHQRVHFQQGQVVILEQLGQVHEDVGELLDLVALQAQLEGQFTTLVGLSADQRVDGGLEDLLGSLVGYFLDVHATFGGGHEHDAAAGTVYHGAQVQFLGDIGAGLDQDLADRLAVGVGLVGHQALAEPVGGERLGVVLALDQLHAARFTAAAGMDLGLDDPLAATDFFAGFCGFFRGIHGEALGYGQAVLSEQLLTLIFVEIHACLPSSFGQSGGLSAVSPGGSRRVARRGSSVRNPLGRRRPGAASPADFSTLLAVGDVDRVAIHGQGRFVQRLGQGRVREDHHAQVFGAGTELHADRALLYQLRSARADHVDAQDAVGLGIGDDLDQAGGVVGSHGATAGREGEGADVDFDAFGLQGLLGLADPGDFRMGVDHRRDQVVVHLGFVAGDALGDHDALFRSLVGQHRATHHVANGEDAGNGGLAVVVDVDVAALVKGHAAVGSQQVGGDRTTTNGNDQLVEHLLLLAFGVGEADGDLLLLHFGTGDTGAQADLQSLLGEDLEGFLGDLLVSGREELVQGFQHGDFGTQAGPYGAQLQADHASADHAELLRHGLEVQGAGGVDDDVLVDGSRGDFDRAGAGCQDHVLGLDDLGLSVGTGDFDLLVGQQLAVAFQQGDAVGLEQGAHAAGQVLNDAVLARDHGRYVDADALGFDAMDFEAIDGLVVLVGAVQQRLRRNAADVQAGTAQSGLAVLVLVFLDAGGLQAQLGCLDGRDAGLRCSAACGVWLATDLDVQQQTSRVFQQVLDGHQEADGFLAIDQTVIVGQSQVHHRADDHLAVYRHGTLDDVVHAEDGGLRRVDDRGRHHRAEGTAVGDGEGATGHLVDGQLALTGLLAEGGDAVLDFGQAHQLGVAQDRNHQATVTGNGYADVLVAVVDDVVAVDRGVDRRETLQRLDGSLDEEGHEAQADAIVGLLEQVLVLRTQGHDFGHVDFVEGGQHGHGGLGFDQTLGDLGTQAGHRDALLDAITRGKDRGFGGRSGRLGSRGGGRSGFLSLRRQRPRLPWSRDRPCQCRRCCSGRCRSLRPACGR
ncbi:hypothetical protein Lal_00048580, partial [Lupinus albus]